MNRELISKLYAQAVDFCVEQGPNPDGTNKAWLWEEKFVELVVKECMDLTNWDKVEMSAEQRIRLGVYQDIRERFGLT